MLVHSYALWCGYFRAGARVRPAARVDAGGGFSTHGLPLPLPCTYCRNMLRITIGCEQGHFYCSPHNTRSYDRRTRLLSATIYASSMAPELSATWLVGLVWWVIISSYAEAVILNFIWLIGGRYL